MAYFLAEISLEFKGLSVKLITIFRIDVRIRDHHLSEARVQEMIVLLLLEIP